MWYVGATCADLVGYWLYDVEGGWRWMLGSAAIPCLLILIGRFELPESPRWLLRKGRVKECEEMMIKLFGEPVAFDEEQPQQTRFRDLFNRRHFPFVLFVAAIWTCQVIPMFAIYTFGPQIVGLGEGSALPVGVPVPWPTATPPAGWLKCDGRAFTKEQYPVLARVYPTLRLPDLRGEFIRGWDDGRKIDEGRKLLSWQKGTLVGGHDDNDSSLDISYMSNGNNIDYGGDKVFAGNYRSDYLWYAILGGTNSRAKAELNGAFFNITRPRNIAFNYIVRAA